MKNNYKKFKDHLKTGGLFFAFRKALKYFLFLIKRRKDLTKQPRIDTISKDGIKVSFSDYGINIFWNGSEISSGAGLNVAVNTSGLWTASTEAHWEVLEKEKDYFKLKVIFRDLPLTQTFVLKIEDKNSIHWWIDMGVEEWLHVDEFRMVCFIKPCYKSWICDYQQADFPRPDNYWHDLHMSDYPASLVGARFALGEEKLPSFVLEVKEREFLPFIQNPPLSTNSHVVGFRCFGSEEGKDYLPGEYRLFSGRITLFEEDYLLDNKIEGLRQRRLEEVVKQKIENSKQERKLRILLVNLPWSKDGKCGVRAGSRWPHIKDESERGYLPFPFFLAYATSLLRKHDIYAFIVDAIAEGIPEDKFLERMLGLKFDYLVTETSVPSFYDDLNLLKKISHSGVPIILCGPNSEIYQARFLEENPFINFVLFREYEFSLLELVQTLQKGGDLSAVKGIIYNEAGSVKKNTPRQAFDINLLPWPHRDSLPMHKYLDAPGEMLTPSVQMLASRGCPFKCQFCLWPHVIYNGNIYRARDVFDVVDEMEYLVRKKGFKSVYFDDDTFNIGKERMLNFCREIRIRGLDKTQWAIMARPDLMDEEILLNMKKAGLWAVKYGVESANQELVDSIDKNMDLKKAEKMIRFTQDLGVKVHLTFTFGLPGETRQTIDRTIRYALKLNPFSVQFSITTPFPGTKYYETLDKKGLIVSRDLSCYDGHFKSVIKLEGLSPEDLEQAKAKAYNFWREHSRKNRGFQGNIERFHYFAKNKGLVHAFYKTKEYFASQGSK